jgi:hypothetical protein
MPINNHLQLTGCITCGTCLQVLELLKDGYGSWPKCVGVSKLCIVQLVANKFVSLCILFTLSGTFLTQHIVFLIHVNLRSS